MEYYRNPGSSRRLKSEDTDYLGLWKKLFPQVALPTRVLLNFPTCTNVNFLRLLGFRKIFKLYFIWDSGEIASYHKWFSRTAAAVEGSSLSSERLGDSLTGQNYYPALCPLSFSNPGWGKWRKDSSDKKFCFVFFLNGTFSISYNNLSLLEGIIPVSKSTPFYGRIWKAFSL